MQYDKLDIINYRSIIFCKSERESIDKQDSKFEITHTELQAVLDEAANKARGIVISFLNPNLGRIPRFTYYKCYQSPDNPDFRSYITWNHINPESPLM